MEESKLTLIFNSLKSRGVKMDHGLTNQEIKQIENEYSFRFPSDLATVLQYKLPISNGFPNWRNGSKEVITNWLERPLEGIIFDTEHNNFWLNSWGEKPKTLEESIEVARHQVKRAPKLIPIYKHRYIPCEPIDKGNPVFSVWQTDIIYYGYDLDDYFNREFGVPLLKSRISEPRSTRFWNEIIG